MRVNRDTNAYQTKQQRTHLRADERRKCRMEARANILFFWGLDECNTNKRNIAGSYTVQTPDLLLRCFPQVTE